jgi:hypothetical protein
MRALYIDPGVTNTGVAIFDRALKRLLGARRFKGRGFRDDPVAVLEIARDIRSWVAEWDGAPISRVVFEWPQIYRESRQRYAKKSGGIAKRDPNNLLPVAALDMAICAFLWNLTSAGCEFSLVRPADWKKQMGANPTARLVLRQTIPMEHDNIEEIEEFAAALKTAEKAGKDVEHPAHNTLDAIGIGLHDLGRFSTRVIER